MEHSLLSTGTCLCVSDSSKHPTCLIFRLKNLIKLANGEVSEKFNCFPTFTDLRVLD